MDPEGVRRHFRAQVPDYAGLMTRLIPYCEEQREIVLRLIPFARDAAVRVLDLGCGPGLLAARILAGFAHAHLTAFDLTEEMLDACRARLAGHDRVTYRLGDFRADDLGRDYDLIVASLSLHHLERAARPALFRRAHASLKPGGCLIAAEVIVDESPSVREHQYRLWREYMTGQGEDGLAWYQKHVAKDHPLEISTLLAMLSEAGFEAAGCAWRYLNFAIVSASRPAA